MNIRSNLSKWKRRLFRPCLADVDFAVINGNYALGAGLTEADGLAFEAADSEAAKTYTNALVVKEGNEDNPAIKKLVEALTSDECRAFLEEKYKGMVIRCILAVHELHRFCER